MKLLLPILIVVFSFSCHQDQETAQRPIERRLSAEWEPTEYIWMQWDQGSYMTSESVEQSLIELLSSITPYHKVRLLVRNSDFQTRAQKLLSENNIDLGKIEFLNIHAKGAITDPSPVFLKTDEGKLATVDFRWNNYGVREVGHPKTIDTDTFDVAVAKKINLDVINQSELVWEGGAMDHNGKGTIIFSEQWMFQRNPTWTKEQIEKELAEKVGVKKVIWLKNGPSEDDFKRILPGGVYPFGTGGHVDEFCRFANDSTILIASVNSEDSEKGLIEKETYQRMEENYAILKGMTDQDGRPFKVVKVPVPDLIIRKIASKEIHPGDAAWFPGYAVKDSINLVLATSYLNFILTDKLVITAKYWEEGRPASMKQKDEEVYNLFTQIFPEQKIIQLNPEAFNHAGGGFHCYTYNEPARE